MTKDEPKMLSDYFKTGKGKRVMLILQGEHDRLGEEKCKDRAYGFLVLDLLLEGLGDPDGFDMEVDEGLFDATPNEVATSVMNFLRFNALASDLLSDNTDAEWHARELAWADYRV